MRSGDDAWREPRTKRSRKQRAKKTPRKDQRAIKDFVKTRRGVEAYVEPRTLDQALSVVFVASDGEWLRFTVPDDSWLRSFGRKQALPIYDAGVMGYPKRMREYRRDDTGGASGSE